ncbi:MAG: hypothetical protein ABSE85_03110 [Candidatus Korobacteraceae bacterium]|jgi:hypothetical protein
MKKAVILLVLLIAVQLIAQDRSTISVKKSEITNGVVIVTVAQGATQGQAKASVQLNCNKDAEACKAPEAGTYLMIRLPKNWGMYDCQNVDLYPSGADPATAEKIGEYCLIEK